MSIQFQNLDFWKVFSFLLEKIHGCQFKSALTSVWAWMGDRRDVIGMYMHVILSSLMLFEFNFVKGDSFDRVAVGSECFRALI